MNKPGAVCTDTKRVAMSLRRFFDLGADIPGYWFNADNEECGLDPWSLVDGIDPHTDGNGFDVWFASGWMVTLAANDPRVIFVSATHAKRVAA
jgi:Protein of unknown function (DUF2761)